MTHELSKMTIRRYKIKF